jgi:hypothetical protein
MLKYLKSFFDGEDQTVEAHLVLATLSILTFLFLAGWTVIQQGLPFNAQDFGIGIGAAFVGVGAAAWGQGKQRREESTAAYNVAQAEVIQAQADKM